MVSGDVQRGVHEFSGSKIKERVVVQVVVELLGSHREAGDRFSGEKALLLVGDYALIAEVDDSVAEHLGVQAEILALAEQTQDCVWDLSDAELERGVILDQRGHMSRNRQGRLIRRHRLEL